MVIQHNISAINSHRNMGINNSQTSKNLEKLSSGYRINRAADDAAGLAISEKMRGQIRGLAMAEQNTSHGINLIQTAEGALNETHAIMQRMRELAVQSSNGTYQDEDRTQLTKEFEALKSEVDRIAESTHYNNIKLLDGSLGGGSKTSVAKIDVPAGMASGTVSDVTKATAGVFETAACTAAGDTTNNVEGQYNVTYTDKAGNEQTVTVDFSGKAATADAEGTADVIIKELENSELGQLFDITNDTGKIVFTAKDAGKTGGATVLSASENITSNAGAAVTTGPATKAVTNSTVATDAYQTVTLTGFDGSNEAKNSFSVNGVEFQFVKSDDEMAALDKGVVGIKVSADAPATAADMKAAAALVKQHTGLNVEADAATGIKIYGTTTPGEGNGLTFQIGANGGADQRVTLNVQSMSAGSLGIKNASIGTIDAANKAIEQIEAASVMVSGQRAELGALQNRLESTMNSLGVSKENLTAAESTIRDVDMAKEMMEFTKNNILVQASQSMLAQANQLPQGVLSLLR